jgi:hypothetical protein
MMTAAKAALALLFFAGVFLILHYSNGVLR